MTQGRATQGTPARERPLLNRRLAAFGTTIFAEMSALAVRTGSINLGQGFPDTDGPEEIREAAVRALREGKGNQYPPGPGVPELRAAVAAHQERFYGLTWSPETEVLVTTGATEAIAASLLALLEPGDEVIAFEPYYDSYAACIALAGAQRVPLTLRAPAFRPDLDELRALITPRTRLLLLNTPHNPTGAVLTPEELSGIAALAVEHDLLVVTDEVYEHLVFTGAHHPIAALPGMRGRTVSISSSGKTFSYTGWKIGWVTGDAPLVAAVRAAKQYLTFVSGGPFQYAIAEALALPDAFFTDFREGMRRKRDLLAKGLRAAGFRVYEPEGTYFITTDISPFGDEDAGAFCRALPERCGVAAVPNSVFYDDPEAGRSQVRFTFCKKDEVLEEAVERLARLG
ncbi:MULTISPECIES: pyridoxal phosphate-dependent aminotransferase [Streptomyces]|uniref:pyridoxal phosphate-dependent aminotransferase n=1 Tax=Streptomyces TaxID=1883 RepID=UPI0001C1B481|nr:pyridoxal phosphate-dependent aminotransferase [Streptomyces sp. ACT-1]EGE43028.1 aminotransferase class I and II [Streptomyces sp. ACT-1]MYR10990.1 pyridoxal phosphate-dependent aminotransferase [Streptomyces sp. SID724]MYR51070.1 pyridoxal phosphate-dependent aminotransferase [Streptomyces sp. SID4928]